MGYDCQICIYFKNATYTGHPSSSIIVINLRNRVILIGTVLEDPEYIKFKTGNRLAKLMVSTTYIYQTKERAIKQTMKHKTIAWNDVADNIKKKLSEGLEVVVDGHLVNRVYTNKNGESKVITEIIVDSFITQAKMRFSEKRA
ncbi:MAG: single-stranded DNA-binding protein [Marinilabiliales bacterium]|nr:MAG: single-stranded DNA-binding protein [Marinilabiliales bacterium]